MPESELPLLAFPAGELLVIAWLSVFTQKTDGHLVRFNERHGSAVWGLIEC